MKENGFTIKKKEINKKPTVPTETIIDVDYADDIVLLANTPIQANILLYSLVQASGGIVLQVHADKTGVHIF